MTDEELIEIRDSLLPSQGEQFDVLEFGRAIDKRNRAVIDELVSLRKEGTDEANHHAFTDDEADEFVNRVRAAITKHTQPKEQA